MLAPFLKFSGSHFWPVLVGSLIPWAILTVFRCYVSASTFPTWNAQDLIEVNYGDLEFWWSWAAGWALGCSLVGERVGRWVRGIYHSLSLLIFVISILDLQFFLVTGARGDWDALSVVAEELPMIWPVVASEFTIGYQLMALLCLLIGLAPIAWKPAAVTTWWRLLAWLLFFPVIHLESQGRPSAPLAIDELQGSVPEYLYWDGVDRMGDIVIPPAPEELALIALHGTPKPHNVVVVILESTSARQTSLHNTVIDTTPNLESLAETGINFKNLLAIVPHTSKALVAILCGQVPRLVSEIAESKPGGRVGACLPELLQQAGWSTAFFQTANEEFEHRAQLTRQLGFEDFRARDSMPEGFAKVNYFGVEDKAMLKPGLDWSSAQKKPFFAVYLTLTSHHDYGVPPDFAKKNYPNAKGSEDKHLNTVRYVDGFLGELLAGYKARGLYDNTIFLVVGDHGEAFGAHGRKQHDMVIWEEGLHVPAVLAGPGIKPGSSIAPRTQLDLVPILLELLGFTVEGPLPGKSLNWTPDAFSFHSCWRSHRCLAKRDGYTKFIDHYRERPAEYFNLARDPLEKVSQLDVLSKEEQATRVAELREWRARVEGRYQAAEARFLQEHPKQDSREALITWSKKMETLGCSLPRSRAVSGQTIWLDCSWRASALLDEGWQLRWEVKIGEVLSSGTWFALDGQLPTWKWPVGLRIDDAVRVRLPKATGEAVVSLRWSAFSRGILNTEPPQPEGWWEVARLQVDTH